MKELGKRPSMMHVLQSLCGIARPLWPRATFSSMTGRPLTSHDDDDIDDAEDDDDNNRRRRMIAGGDGDNNDNSNDNIKPGSRAL